MNEIIDDMEVLRNTLASKGLSLTLRIIAQAIRLNAAALKQGELTDKRIKKEAILQEYERIAQKLDNQATGLQITIRNMTENDSIEVKEGNTNASAETA